MNEVKSFREKHEGKEPFCNLLFPTCPIRNVLDRVGDKWSLLVMYTLQKKSPLRFKELLLEIPDISERSLSKTLRVLEEDDFVTRSVFNEAPPRVEYALTPRAKSFYFIVEELIYWAKENINEIYESRGLKIPKPSTDS